jgi:hypothetical protein
MYLTSRKTTVKCSGVTTLSPNKRWTISLCFLCVYATSYVDMSTSVIRVQMSVCQDLA